MKASTFWKQNSCNMMTIWWQLESQRKKETENPGPNQKILQINVLQLWRTANLLAWSFEWKGSWRCHFRPSWLYWWQPSAAINYPKVINSIQSTLPIKPIHIWICSSIKQMTWTNVYVMSFDKSRLIGYSFYLIFR